MFVRNFNTKRRIFKMHVIYRKKYTCIKYMTSRIRHLKCYTIIDFPERIFDKSLTKTMLSKF